MITVEDKLVYKKYQIVWHELPIGVRKKIYRDYPLGDLSKMLTEYKATMVHTTWRGRIVEFESMAHYNWFIMKWS